MKFDLRKPCEGDIACPFRTDCLPGWLGAGRAAEIVNSLERETFACHKTTEEDDEDDVVTTSDTQHCAGALILREKMEAPSQIMRIAERLGMYDYRKLDMNAPVFDSEDAFIQHHATADTNEVKKWQAKQKLRAAKKQSRT